MMVDTEGLMTVRHFASVKGVSTTAVYSWVAQDKEKAIKIDGVMFIVVNKDDLKG